MIKGNKGEWSEFYAFIKLLVDKKIIGADKDLKKIDSIVFPILKIVREEFGDKIEYEFQNKEKIKIFSKNLEKIVDISDLKTRVADIFNEIKNNSQTFSVSNTEDLFDRLKINKLNAGNSKKEDLVLKIHDHIIGKNHEIGFSLKSKLGSPATLLNASGATNFTYKIFGLNKREIKEINKINTKSKVRDRLIAIVEKGGKFIFHKVDSEIFERNLRKIDTVMPEIIAEILLAYFSDNGSTFSKLLSNISSKNIKIFNFKLSTEDYIYKIKALLNNTALGMVPASSWDGTLRAHGGVIVIREDGEIVCYHLYNAEEFRNYLFNNTRLESPSTTRHKYGSVYEKGGDLFIKLNLQIRFTK